MSIIDSFVTLLQITWSYGYSNRNRCGWEVPRKSLESIGEQIQSPMFITATHPVTSLFGAFGKYIYDNGIQLADVEQVMLTGVGSAFVNSPLYGLPNRKTDEFIANGLGRARHATDIDQLIVVSMGTGTSFVKIDGTRCSILAAWGLVGGTLQGLSRLLLKTHDIHQVSELAEKGDVTRVNLQIGDICNTALPDLPVSATASLFGKADSNASQEDIACGIIYTVLQTIGGAAVLSALNSPIKDFVLIGNLTQLPQCREVFSKMEAIYHVHFHIPPYAEYRTAIGAALAYVKERQG